MSALDDIPPDERTTLRAPPHSAEAEQSLLGGLLLNSTAYATVSDLITADDFFSAQHRTIFAAIVTQLADSKPVDVISTFENLQRAGKAAEVGGMQYLNALAASLPNAGHLRRYAEIIVERATLRSIIKQADIAATKAFGGESAASILDSAKTAFGGLQEARNLASKRVPLLSLSELREQAIDAPWLVKHVIPAESIGMMYGGSGTFKSFIAVDAALHVAHGLPWMGRRTKQGPVLYIAAEGGSGLWPRIVAWHRARRLQWSDVPLHVVPAALDLTADAWRVVEAAQAKGVHPAMVIVDTLSQTYAGEENSANEIAAYFRELGTRFRQLWGCSVLILHHTGHLATERPRGSSAMRANLDYMLGVFRDEKEMLATLTCAKQKDGEAFEDVAFAVTKHTLGTDPDGDPITSLVARHLSNVEEMQEAMEVEAKAGRGGHNHLLLSLLQNGQAESELRTVFYRECGLDSADSRKKAYQRAKSWAVGAGLVEVSEGYVLLLKTGGQA